MKLRRASRLMLKRYGDLLRAMDSDVVLPKQLQLVLDRGVTEHDGCIFLTDSYEKSRVTPKTLFRDKFVEECTANHIHIDHYVTHDAVKVGIACLRTVSNILQAMYPSDRFRGTLNLDADTGGTVVCFHRLRGGEKWNYGDWDKNEIGSCFCEFDL
jgi:hypothetical protein